LLLAYVFLVGTLVGVIAWVASPNTDDAMSYHLGRVIHWVQNKSVAFYPTHILRQLHQNPWSEFAILHFYILQGGDHFANFVQWFSMLGSVIGVSLLAQELRATIRGQLFAAALCITIPMGILQGSSTQTDYVVSFWLVCFVYFSVCIRKQTTLPYILGAGLSLGLAILTKATAYIFAFPFLAWLILSSIKLHHTKKLAIILALAIAFSINLGHYTRNADLYGSPLGPGREGDGYGYTNEIYSFSAVASNFVRNIGLHIGTPINWINAGLERRILILHGIIGISPNDVHTTWPGTEFHISRLSFHEDTAGNPIHLFLIAASLLLFIFQRPKEYEGVVYIISLLLAFLLFCAFLKWQPWHSRLHLPLFVLAAPFLGLVLSRTWNTKIINSLMVLLMVTTLPWVLLNWSRPILGKNSIFTTSRIEQYFKNRPTLADPYIKSAHILADMHCSDVGLLLGGDDWEYPLWMLLREKATSSIYVEHINVSNVSHQKHNVNHLDETDACAIFAVSADLPDTISVGNSVYSQRWSSDSVGVYTQASGSS
jgi:hypothetical protein